MSLSGQGFSPSPTRMHTWTISELWLPATRSRPSGRGIDALYLPRLVKKLRLSSVGS